MSKGIVHKLSQQNFSDTYQKLKEVIESNPNISIVAELDHQKNAQKVNLTLLPSKVILFGNPNLGTPLMQENPIMGLDLPQKILVHQNEMNQVFISYHNPLSYEDCGLNSKADLLKTIANALDTITDKAI